MTNSQCATYIDLSQKRDIIFPYTLSVAGVINTPENVTYCINYNTLEFCLRLKSDDQEAVDDLDGEIYRYRFPHLFIKRPGVKHSYSIEHSRYAVFLIYPAELLPEFEKIGMQAEPPGIEFELTPELGRLISDFLQLLPHSHMRGSAEKFDIIAFQMLENIYMQKIRPPENDRNTDHSIRAIASYLQLNFNTGIDVNEICRKFGMSRRAFFRNWSKHYDLSPLQYIMDLKMKEAVRLLSIQPMQIQDIAEKTGFDNYSYFIQVFRKYNNGMTPGEYRKTMKPPTLELKDN